MTHPIRTFLGPLHHLALAFTFLPQTFKKIIKTRNKRAVTSWSEFKRVWFAIFWAWYGPLAAECGVWAVTPMHRRLCRGVVLDVGPGAGHWLSLFTEGVQNGEITRIYGVEPNEEHHEALKRRVEEAGLQDVYVVLAAEVGDLSAKPGGVDTICTFNVLCSVPDPEILIHELAGFLGEGGSWLVYEHVKTEAIHGKVVEYWQNLLNLVWPHVFNGCNLNRNTIEWIAREAEWKHTWVGLPPGPHEDRRWEACPGVVGCFIKA